MKSGPKDLMSHHTSIEGAFQCGCVQGIWEQNDALGTIQLGLVLGKPNISLLRRNRIVIHVAVREPALINPYIRA
jgi:hypothetical protein